MKICIYSKPFYPSVGGIERIGQLLATVAVEKGYVVEVVTDTPTDYLAEDLQCKFKITRTTSFGEQVRAFKSADRVLFMGVSLRGLAAAIVARSQVVLSHHGTYYGTGFFSRFKPFLKRLVTCFYPNISCSEYVAKSIPGKSVVIHNAYDDKLFLIPDNLSREFDFVYCGRMVSYKMPGDCLNAYLRVLAVIPDATLTFIGDGPERKPLEKSVAMLGLGGKVRFTGSLIGAPLVRKLQDHACMLVPSIGEAFGIVALEGIACCDSVIVYDSGGLPEAIGACGTAVKPDQGHLSQAMLEIAKFRRGQQSTLTYPDPKIRKMHLYKHSPEVIAQKYFDVVDMRLSI